MFGANSRKKRGLHTCAYILRVFTTVSRSFPFMYKVRKKYSTIVQTKFLVHNKTNTTKKETFLRVRINQSEDNSTTAHPILLKIRHKYWDIPASWAREVHSFFTCFTFYAPPRSPAPLMTSHLEIPWCNKYEGICGKCEGIYKKYEGIGQKY